MTPLDGKIEVTIRAVIKNSGVETVSTLLELAAHNFKENRIPIVEAVIERWPDFKDQISVKYAPKFPPLIKLRLHEVENNEAVDQNVRSLAGLLRAFVR